MSVGLITHSEMKKLKDLLEEYGRWALFLHLLMWGVTFCVVFCIIQFGMRDWVVGHLTVWFGGEYAQAGTILVAYAATKLTQPIRLMMLVVLVPFVKRHYSHSDSDDLENANEPVIDEGNSP